MKSYEQLNLLSRDITLTTRVHLVKAMVFPVVMYWCESWTIKKAECQRTDAFELWCWRRLLRVPWTARRFSHWNLKLESLEGLMLKLQYFGHLMGRTDSLEKTPMLGKIEKRTTEYKMFGQHHRLDGHEFSFFFFIIFFSFFFICSEFCHTLEWNSHGFTCVPHPDPPSHLPLHPLPLGFPSAPGPSTCLMHPTWAGDLFQPRYYTCFDAVLLKHPTLSFSHRV